MLFGLAIGLIVALAVYVNGQDGPESSIPQAATTAPIKAATVSPGHEEAEPAPSDATRFDFYEMLPQFEVIVPDRQTRQETRSPSIVVKEPGRYIVQAGSFQTMRDADARRANLALLGIESRIQVAPVADDTFHRVLIGPIADLDAVNATQRRLLDAEIEFFLMKYTEPDR